MAVKLSLFSTIYFSVSALALTSQIAEANEVEQPGSVYDAYEDKESADKTGGEAGTVVSAIRAALTHNPQIRIAAAQKDAAEADRFRALGGFLPDISATATYTDDSWNNAPASQTLPTDQGTTVGVTAVQPVFQGLSAVNSFRAARARVSQSDLSLLAAMQQTALDAARAHAGVVLARAIVDHRIENMSLVSQQLTVSEKRAKAGAQSRTGVDQSRMRLAQAQVDLGEARTRLAQQEAAFIRITGNTPETNLIPYTGKLVDLFSSAEDAKISARANNPNIGAADASAAAAKFDKNTAIGAFAPQLTFEASYFKRYGEDPLTASEQNEEYQLLARMRVPIFQQGTNIAGIRSANASVAQQEAQLTVAILAIEEIVNRSWRQYDEANARVIAARSGIDAARQSVKGLQMEYEAGQRSVIDVLDGQRDLVTAQINASQAEFDLMVSQYELAAATGTILDAFEISLTD